MTVDGPRQPDYSLVMVIISLGLLLGGTFVCLSPELLPSARNRSITQIILGLRQRDLATLGWAEKHVSLFPQDMLGLALYADAAAQRSEHELAIGLYKRLPEDGGRWELRRCQGLARRYEILGKLADSETQLNRVLDLVPNQIWANDCLGNLKQVEGRTWEAARHFFAEMRMGKCSGDELLAMAVTERFFWRDERLERLLDAHGSVDILMRLSFARRALFENRLTEAEKLLREVVAERPDLGEAQGRLGRIIVDRGDSAEFLQWFGQLSEDARNHPEVWFVAGVKARRLGQMEGAVHCFLRTLTMSPNHLAANVQISGCLERLNKLEAARQFSHRAELLAEFESAMNLVRNTTDIKLLAKTSNILGKLGRYWEAAGWNHVILTLYIEDPQERYQTQTQIRGEMRKWLRLARAEPGPDAPSTLPSRLLKLADYHSPRWPLQGVNNAKSRSSTTNTLATDKTAWNFMDDADRLGIRFQYYEGTTEKNRMQHIFNTMGGGLGAVDFDNDGWPDLYLAQANNWRNPEPQPAHRDRLFRNAIGDHFEDVTDLALLNEVGFSHGVTVGDYDQDGFADIYIGNKGPNRLYHNNGDGTFTDVTETSQTAGNEWSTSSVFADLNGDGLPELYVLNYTQLKATAERECFTGQGRPMACTPDLLIAEADRCYLNLGNGEFQDISKEAGIDTTDGKGLGIIAWDFAGTGKLGIFIANDTTPNFLMINQEPMSTGIPHYRDEALVRGIALDADGNAQASMGVAAGDANGDGRIDLFVTTFFGESKTLFCQRDDRFFDDLTRTFDLRNPGFWMLGFGSQFADLNGDGWEDLIATNGHVDQQSIKGDPDRMPPQVFQNLGGQRFAEVPGKLLGPFFEGRYIGRGLAILDWNRDGWTDVGISHLHGPFALLTNHCRSVNRPLVVKLIGRSGCREPIGATVRLKYPPRAPAMSAEGTVHSIRLVTGGSGFLVTNESRLQFAVPPAMSEVDLEVDWPGGRTESWSQVKVGQEILLIEGRLSPVTLREYSHNFGIENGVSPP